MVCFDKLTKNQNLKKKKNFFWRGGGGGGGDGAGVSERT